MSVHAIIARARSAVGHATIYRLGAGGMVPSAKHPANGDGACDCSGFVAWVFGVSRHTTHKLYQAFNGGWINTDAMVHDAKTGGGMLTRLAFPRPGCIAVYPSAKGRAYGHVGLVTEVDGGAIRRVVHCSAGNYRSTGDAIRETPPTVFRAPDMIFAWWDALKLDMDAVVHPLRTWAIVASTALNVRRTPDTSQPSLAMLPKGTRIIVDATAEGERVAGNATWYRRVDGGWVWAGATDQPKVAA